MKEIHPKLPRAPLFLVITHIGFLPIETIESYIPSIQEKLRLDGFPYFMKQPLQQITFNGPDLHLDSTIQWSFADKKKKTSIVLGRNTVAIHTCDYSVFSEYVATVIKVVRIISDALNFETGGGILERIGLRYIDLLEQIDDIKPLELINPEFIGGFTEEEKTGKILARQVVTEQKTDIDGVLRTILLQPRKPHEFLMQFAPLGLNNFPQSTGPLVVLDAEHFQEGIGEDFTVAGIEKKLSSLHSDIDKVFFKRVPTLEALKLWEKEA